LTSPDTVNNTTTYPLVGAGSEHRKVPNKIIIIIIIIIINKLKKTAPTVDAGPQPCKSEVNKRKQQAPNQ
jgi:hypothetical protein